jgi:hypothetical protein
LPFLGERFLAKSNRIIYIYTLYFKVLVSLLQRYERVLKKIGIDTEIAWVAEPAYRQAGL